LTKEYETKVWYTTKRVELTGKREVCSWVALYDMLWVYGRILCCLGEHFRPMPTDSFSRDPSSWTWRAHPLHTMKHEDVRVRNRYANRYVRSDLADNDKRRERNDPNHYCSDCSAVVIETNDNRLIRTLTGFTIVLIL